MKQKYKINNQSQDDAIWDNMYDPLSSSLHSTGFKTYAMQYRMRDRASAVTISEEFLMNSYFTKDNREMYCSISTYLQENGVTLVSLIDQESRSNHEIQLPENVPLTMELGEALMKRRSIRQFTGQACNFNHAATLLRAACGVTSQKQVALSNGNMITLHQRTAPSGGGLYPIELYALMLNVNQLKKGLYRYNAINDTIIQLSDRTMIKKLLSTFAIPTQQLNYTQACIIIMLIGHPWRSMRKYGARGLRFVIHEAGSIAQNIHLSTAALGLGSVDCASLYDDEVHDILNLDGRYTSLMGTVVIGVPE